MCSIAGILFKNGNRKNFPITTGQALTAMLTATLHRGPDSAGWALYREPVEGRIRLRFFVPAGEEGRAEKNRIARLLENLDAKIVASDNPGCTFGVAVEYGGEIANLCSALQDKANIVSVGESLDIVKDTGQPADLAKIYNVPSFDGTHGLAHNRLATESGVYPDTTHPFWAPGFKDVCTVHNGMITNYWKMRRRLEQRGMRFQSNNDTELIAVYLAYRMSQGATLEESLKSSLDDFDGTFSYLVSTSDAIGYAKDKLAAKPVVVYEDDDMVAVCSEEVGLNALFPGKSLSTDEKPPYTYGLWSLGS
jgi:methylamine---glutamate N-methyltransferase subunit A